MTEPNQGIKVVTLRTGLTAHVIRIWEKRYGAVKPVRTETNRRLYSNEQIERLCLLRDITKSGHSIGNVAIMPTEELRELLIESLITNRKAPRKQGTSTTAETYLDECITAVKELDSHSLEETLKYAMIELGAQNLLQRVIAPLIHAIGDLWSVGTLTAAHEHFASAIIRVFLGHAARPFARNSIAPVIVIATPTGQIHEMGALLCGAAAANLGWLVTYLGASLPAAHIAGAARQTKARVVALSLVYPSYDPQIAEELKCLRELLPSDIALIVGGRAMTDYHEVLESIGAIQVKELEQLASVLKDLRKPVLKG